MVDKLTYQDIRSAVAELDKTKIPRQLKMKQQFFDKLDAGFNSSILKENFTHWRGIPVEVDDNIKSDYEFIY